MSSKLELEASLKDWEKCADKYRSLGLEVEAYLSVVSEQARRWKAMGSIFESLSILSQQLGRPVVTSDANQVLIDDRMRPGYEEAEQLAELLKKMVEAAQDPGGNKMVIEERTHREGFVVYKGLSCKGNLDFSLGQGFRWRDEIGWELRANDGEIDYFRKSSDDTLTVEIKKDQVNFKRVAGGLKLETKYRNNNNKWKLVLQELDVKDGIRNDEWEKAGRRLPTREKDWLIFRGVDRQGTILRVIMPSMVPADILIYLSYPYIPHELIEQLVWLLEMKAPRFNYSDKNASIYEGSSEMDYRARGEGLNEKEQAQILKLLSFMG